MSANGPLRDRVCAPPPPMRTGRGAPPRPDSSHVGFAMETFDRSGAGTAAGAGEEVIVQCFTLSLSSFRYFCSLSYAVRSQPEQIRLCGSVVAMSCEVGKMGWLGSN
ncbi:hypothetical protein GOODEAATRI_016299 [Goodea atripinnis]|uniref:Uncharacterized protein n=1 Tax=Goodea atripinnis TaxID=208336 RepID=A0ABV0MIA8_9TELE